MGIAYGRLKKSIRLDNYLRDARPPLKQLGIKVFNFILVATALALPVNSDRLRLK